MKRIILTGLILLCIVTAASADLGPVLVNHGEYTEIFDGEVHSELNDGFTVAMVEGGAWEAYVGLDGDMEERKGKEKLSWEITTEDGSISLGKGEQNEYGYAYIMLPESLESGNNYKLIYSYGEKQEILAFKVITAEEAELNTNRGALEITGFEDGDELKPIKSEYSDYTYLKFRYNQCGFERINITIEKIENGNSVGTTRIDENCDPWNDGKNVEFDFTYSFFREGGTYRITFEQGDQKVSKEFVVSGDGASSSYSGSSGRTSAASKLSKAEQEDKVSNAASSATDGVISKINYQKGTKKKNNTTRKDKVSITKTYYYNINNADGGIPPTIIDYYLNSEMEDSTSEIVHSLSEEMVYLKSLAKKEYPDEIYVFPEYAYTLKRDDYNLNIIPFFAKKDGENLGNKMYTYCLQQVKGDFKFGGKKYTQRRIAFIITDEYNTRNLLRNAFPDIEDKAWKKYINGSKISAELMDSAISANDIDNQVLPIGQVIIRKDSDVRVRISPDMDAEVIGTAKKGASYLLYEVEDNGWLKIKMQDGNFGYVGKWLCSKYIDKNSEAQKEEAEPEQPKAESPKSEQEQPKPEQPKSENAPDSAAESDSTIESSGEAKGILIKNKVGLRETPQKNGRKIRLLDKGAKVDVIGKTSNSEGVWYYVQFNKDKGYLSSEMLEVSNASSVPEM